MTTLISNRFILLFIMASAVPVFLAACAKGKGSTCESCHSGIEKVSASHSSCTSCHGGDAATMDKKASHKGMYGPANPSEPRHWQSTCGACHAYQTGRVASTIMHTNTGMIGNIQLTWEGGDAGPFAAAAGTVYDPEGKPLDLKAVAGLDNLSGELYRKFCSRCHIGIETSGVTASSHASGCAACHFPYNDTATYTGKDATVKGKAPYSASHTLSALPDNEVCSRCHNRSGRIALSYQGLYDGNNSLVPTRSGLPGPLLISGGRNIVHIASDVHFAAGMDCIDCHTSRDIMGDGFSYRTMYQQTEIRCEDCHGGTKPPRYVEIKRENEEPLRESKNYRMLMRSGMRMIVTSKGRPYSNVFYKDGTVYVLGKRSGRLFKSKVITGNPEHSIVGHGRMECYSCHSRTVVQCFGCHTKYDRNRPGFDFIKGEDSPGEFSETEDFRKLYPFPLAINQRGLISPVTPGCQTFVTVAEADGRLPKYEYVMKYKGKNQLRFAPFYSHNTGKKAVGCGECHANPAFLGFGQHVISGGTIESTLICERSADKPLDGFLTMEDGTVKAFSAVTREHSRPLNGAEVKRTLAANLCIICHDRAADPIYRKELDYRALEDSLHRRLLSVRR